jgi:exodeoxyribonuclease VII small subunit
MQQNQNENSFESSLKELERIIQELEKGEQPIDAQLKAFERGVSLSRECLQRLEEVERRVEIAVQSADGKLQTGPFDSAPA